MSRVKSIRVAAVASDVNSLACRALAGAISTRSLPAMSWIIPCRTLIQVFSSMVARLLANFR